jgi:hypothetical protein
LDLFAPYTFTQFRTIGNYSAIALLHTCQFTVPHALRFSFFTGRILATDLSQSHCNFKSHMKISCHSLIFFLPFLLSHLLLPSPELDPILFRLLFCIPCFLLLRCRVRDRARVKVTLRLAICRQSIRLGDEPLETNGHNFFSQLNTCVDSLYITSSLTRGRVCRLYMLLALTSVISLGSEYLGSPVCVLLSQI